MRRRMIAVIVVALAATVTAVAWLQQPTAARPATMAALMPPGATLVVEAKDLSSLLRDWNGSRAKQAWLDSANYQVFVRSHLYLRLQEAYGEFAKAAGVPPDMALVSDVAGSESALALYDIGKLEFLYVTRLPSAKAMENALWKTRGTYEPRDVNGTPFYVRKDAESERVVAFGARDGYLLLATREDLLAGALTRIGEAGAQRAANAAAKAGADDASESIESEAWYAQSVKAAGAPGDLRLVLDLATLVKEPHFQSYWIQENVEELKEYSSAVSDLVRTATEFRETRVLVRAEEQPANANSAGTPLSDLIRLVPANAGLYRAWSAPTAAQASTLLADKVIATSAPTSTRNRTAPSVGTTPTVTGSAGDLETRIDVEATRAPKPQTSDSDAHALDHLVASEPLTGLLHLESTRPTADNIFIARGSVIVFSRASEWPKGAAREALRTMLDPMWTKAHLGLRWIDTQVGAQKQTISHLEGLETIAVAERGRLLFIANDLTLLAATLDAAATPSAAAAQPNAAAAAPASAPGLDAHSTYAAGFRHGLERDRFVSMMRLLDHTNANASANTTATASAASESDASTTTSPTTSPTREPQFFSENLVSLSDTFTSIDTATIVVSDTGPTVSQTVTYRLR
jgi:hypothetical protein